MFLRYLTLASGINFLFLSVALFLRKVPNKKPNNILGLFFLMMSIYSIMVSLRFGAYDEGNLVFLGNYTPIDGVFLLFMGPTIYFYMRSILNKPIFSKKWHLFLHLIPLVPFIAFNIYFSTWSYVDRIEWMFLDFTQGTLETNLLNIVLYIQMPLYLLFSHTFVKNQLHVSSKVMVGNIFIDVSWLRFFIKMNLVFMIISAPLCFYFHTEKSNIIIGQIGMNIQFIYISFKSAWQSRVFPIEIHQNKYRKNTVNYDKQLESKYLDLIANYMKVDKPFLNENCNIQSVSLALNITVHQLSSIINQCFQRSFSDYINEFRIAEAKILLVDSKYKNLTLESIGFECGFGSKSNFNKTFKKLTNYTPSEFRKQMNCNFD